MTAPAILETAVNQPDSSAVPSGKGGLRLEVYSSFEAAGFIRNEWTELLQEVQGDLFGSFEWCATWWRHFSKRRRLEIYAFWTRDELVALFPCFRETLHCGPFKLRVVRFLGCDHAGTRCWPIFKSHAIRQVASLFLESLSHSQSWDLLQIGDLPGYFHQANELVSGLQTAGRHRVCVNRNYYPHALFSLPADFETYLVHLSGNERNNIRKNERRLAKTHGLQHALVAEADREAFLSDYFDWHEQYWESQNQLGFFALWPGAREFHRDFIVGRTPSQHPVLFRVHADGQPVGVVCAHGYNNRLHLFQAIRAPDDRWESYGPGRLLHCEMFRWCMSQGIAAVDAMSGFYEYKRRLGADFLGLTMVSVLNAGTPSRKRAARFRRIVGLVNATYFRLWLCNMAPVLRKRFPVFDGRFLRAGMNEWFIRSRFLLAAFPVDHPPLDEAVQDVQNV